MNKIVTLGIGLYLTAFSSVNMAEEPVFIVDYLVEPVSICDVNDECTDVEHKMLPDLSESPLSIIDYDEADYLLQVNIDGKPVWIDRMEVQITKTAKASVACNTQDLTDKADKSVYASFGLGEGCK